MKMSMAERVCIEPNQVSYKTRQKLCKEFFRRAVQVASASFFF